MIDIKHTAKEIVRGMTNAKLTFEQQQQLLHVAQIVISNQFIKTREKRTYKIWAEGYLANETEGRKTEPAFFGESDGGSFEDACINRFKDDKFFDKASMTYWGCKLYGGLK